ncbi:MAG: glycerol-3-phosphate 1-O-acyltransferase PlsY [Anaerolineae bacterium]
MEPLYILGLGLAFVLAYLVGAIPMGLLVVKALTGEDVRQYGSGRTGGTNAMRAGGVKAGVLTGLGDLLKGVLAVNIGRLLFPGDPVAEAVCAVAAVVGHNWSIYIGFKGGAGTGANVGAAVALWPLTAAIMIPFVPLVLYLTGYASVTSTLASLLLVAIFILRAALAGQPIAYVVYAVITALLVAIALIPNYKRLLAGTERVVGLRARKLKQMEQSSSS